MLREKCGAIVMKRVSPIIVLGMLVVLPGAGWQAMGQDAKVLYQSMAPVDQYLMADRDQEIALARSAAPESVARDAEVLVLGRHGYETAVQGKNGFVCVVERSWMSPIDDPDFWNPKSRGPLCVNAASARSYLKRTIKRTELILAGQTKAQMVEAMTKAIDSKELPPMEPGAMCYMLSKQGVLNSRDGHWHPHLMFFVSQMEPEAWGANLEGAQIYAFDDKWEHLTTFLVPVGKWSDGTVDQ